jgi:hypothetical protein
MKKTFLMILIFAGVQNAQAQCEDFEMTITVSHPTCYNYSDGNISVSTTGGTAPVNGTITNENGIIVDNGKKTFSLMGGGWYYIYLVDANGCELYDSVYLDNPPKMIAQMVLTDPSFTGACDGVAEIDTVLNYQGAYENIGYFWSPGGPYGIGQTIKTDLCDANYNVVINDEIGCHIIEYMAVGSVGVQEEDDSEKMLLFPNPAQQFTTLQTQQPIVEFFVTDYAGRRIIQLSGETKTEIAIDLNDLPNGLYQLGIVFEDSVKFLNFIRE